MKLKSLLCIHSWISYYFDTQRSCAKCKTIQSAGMTGDDDDWHSTYDHNVKRALRHFVMQLGLGKDENRGLR